MSFHEQKTAVFVEEKLKSFSHVEVLHPSDTSVLGVLKGKESGKTILLRADMDALPMREESGCPLRRRLKRRIPVDMTPM